MRSTTPSRGSVPRGPDPQRLGALGWSRRTAGRLTSRERRRLLAAPGVTVERDGELGCYLQWGAMVDGAGLRIWDVTPSNVAEVLSRYPRGDFKLELAAMMRAEASAVPHGRFGLLVRCGLPLAVRMAPFES